jgi:Flp pilus assembly protein CpaB
MNSEAIVVLILLALAVGFIIWIRMNSHDHDISEQAGNVGEGGKNTDIRQ